jgi:hypothetical protein
MKIQINAYPNGLNRGPLQSDNPVSNRNKKGINRGISAIAYVFLISVFCTFNLANAEGITGKIDLELLKNTNNSALNETHNATGGEGPYANIPKFEENFFDPEEKERMIA